MPVVLTHRPAMPMAHVDEPCASCAARPFSVCNAVPDEDLYHLAAVAEEMTVPAGEEFIVEGDAATHFFNVTGGTVRLFKSLADGRRQITGFAPRGHFLGLAVSDNYGFSAEAVDNVRICRFRRSRLRGLLDDFPALEKRLLETAGNELVAAQEQMLLLGRKSARERVASFLLAQARTCGTQKPPCTQSMIPLPMTRSDIADYLGLTIETVSRTLTQLRNDGVISQVGVSGVSVSNRVALETAAGRL